jgi:pimeloyl-ACP methyl ester carboxylesterase
MVERVERYSPERVVPFSFDDPERMRIFMREVIEPVTFRAEDGQAFSGIFVNRDFANRENPLHVRLNSMFGDSAGADQKYIAFQEAAAFPSRPFIVIDQPAHGESDILTPGQMREIKKMGQLTLVAAAHVQAVRSRVPDAREVVLSGEALGARMAAEFAAEAPAQDFQATHFFGFDMAGLEKRSSAALGLGFLARVPKSRQLYSKGAHNVRLQRSFEEFQQELESYAPVHLPTARSEAKVWQRQISLLTFLLRNSPLANDEGAAALERGLQNNEGMAVNLVFGGLSAVGRMNKEVEARLQNLDRLYRGDVGWVVWPNDDQGLGYAPHRPRLTQFIKDTLHSS